MAKGSRYLWGKTKVDFVDFRPQTTAPAAKAGRMYVDANGWFRFCEDGTSFQLIRDVLHN